MRLTLELRIMGDSNLIMAPQRGNRWGTASIEILSVPDAVRDEEWLPFCQEVVDLWAGYKGRMTVDGEERLLNVRPHWAKEWEGVKIRGRKAREYVREVGYREEVGEFRAVLGEIGREQGWGLEDLKGRFSNELWDYVVFDGMEGGKVKGGEGVQNVKMGKGNPVVMDVGVDVKENKETKPLGGVDGTKTTSPENLTDNLMLERKGKGKEQEQERKREIKINEVESVESKGVANNVSEVKSLSSSAVQVQGKVVGIQGGSHACGVLPVRLGR